MTTDKYVDFMRFDKVSRTEINKEVRRTKNEIGLLNTSTHVICYVNGKTYLVKKNSYRG